MAPKLKLIYFPLEARGQCARLLCAAGNIPLEQETIGIKEWPQRKHEFPYGRMPLLIIDGKTELPEHLAICRYLAKLAKLTGKHAEEDAEIDAIVDACNDLYADFPSLGAATVMNSNLKDLKAAIRQRIGEERAKKLEGHPETKAAAWKEYEEKNKGTLDRFDESVRDNPKGWLVGDKMTWADVYVAQFFHRIIEYIEPMALRDRHPKLRQLVDKVYANKGIADYMRNGPKFGF